MAMARPASPELKTPAPGAQTLLELQDVVKHYHSIGEKVRAVDGVSLSLQAAEMLAIHGPSGSGKTTLLLLAAAILRAEAGVIRYRGRDLSDLSPREQSGYLGSEVGFIHQHVHLMPRVRAIENAALYLILGGMGLRAAMAEVTPWLERVGLSGRLSHTPEQLSGGERQRVAIARVLAKRPRLILADEPTGNLDSVRSRQIIELLGQVAREQGAGVLLVTHDLEAAAIADRRVVLRDGRLQGASGHLEARRILEEERDGQVAGG